MVPISSNLVELMVHSSIKLIVQTHRLQFFVTLTNKFCSIIVKSLKPVLCSYRYGIPLNFKNKSIRLYSLSTPIFLAYFRPLHCKPNPFGKQFCLAYTAIFPSYITFQNNQQKIFNPKQMWIYGALTFAPPPSWTLWHSDLHYPTL